MDENTIFKSPAEIGAKPEEMRPSEDLPISPSPSKLFKILKILLGVIILLAIIFAAWNFVLPRFFPGSNNDKVTLVYWGLLEDAPQVAPIIEEFERNNPNIKIQYSKQDIKQYRERLITRSNNGNGPDIFRFHNSWVPQLSGLLLPLPESAISKEDFVKTYYPVAVEDLVRDGAIYGAPLQIDTLNLYINTELFKAAGLRPPTTWIEFGEYSRQLTVKDENNNIKTAGSAMGTFENITNAPDIISMLFVQDGVDLKDISSNLDRVSDALQFYTSFATAPSNVWDNALDQSIRMFGAGSLAMYFGYSRDFFTIKAINPELSFEIHPAPVLPDQNKTIASYWVEGVSSKSRHQKEAFLFMKYLTLKETQQKLFAEQSKVRSFGEPYSRIDLADSLKSSVSYPFVSSAQFATSSFFVDGTNDNGINSQVNAHLNIAVDSILKGTSPQSASETLSQGVSQVLKQYGL